MQLPFFSPLLRVTILFAITLVVIIALPMGVARAASPNLIVNSSDDAYDPTNDFDSVNGGCKPAPQHCSLREAMLFAAAAHFVISFDPSMAGQTIVLTNTALGGNLGGGEWNNSSPVTLDGSALSSPVTIDGNNHQYHLYQTYAGQSMTFKSIHFANMGCSNCTGGVIYNGIGSWITFTNSIFTNNYSGVGGGTIAGPGNLTVINSTFSGNYIANNINFLGGAIQFSAFSTEHLTIKNSTFYSNSAPGSYGGAIAATSGNADIINSTFSANSALNGGAIHNQSAGVRITNSTISGNLASGSYGGIETVSTGMYTLTNSILSNNSGSNCGALGGTIANGGHNIEDGSSCGWGSNNGSLSNLNPRLGALGEYGGATQTIPLLPGSSALDAGDATACAEANSVNNLDQRGVARPQNSVCDIGAFESRGFTLTVSGGRNQSAYIFNPYALSLSITVTNGYSEPVNGGIVTFTVPSSGASANLGNNLAIIAGSAATTTATANSIRGSFIVTGATTSASPILFSLTNLARLLYLPFVTR